MTTFMAVNGARSGPGSVTGTVAVNIGSRRHPNWTYTAAWWSTVQANGGDNNPPACSQGACDSFTFAITNATQGYYKIQCNVDPGQGNSTVFIGFASIPDTCETGQPDARCPNWTLSSGSPNIRTWEMDNANNFTNLWVTTGSCRHLGGNPLANNQTDARVWYLTPNNYTLTIMVGDQDVYFNSISLMWDPPAGTATPTLTRTPTNTPSPTITPTVHNATPTYTGTPTFTPTPLPKVYAGLPVDKRPYGLEYVPFPTVGPAQGASSTFYGLDATFSAASSAPVNTARWHIEFYNLSTVASLGNLTNGYGVETRIGPYGVSCVTGVYDPNLYATATSLTLPARPTNYSSAYFWVSNDPGDVPNTESFDAVGDPRFMPYADLLDYSGAPGTAGQFQGNYNWFFRNFSKAGSYTDGGQHAYYKNFIPSAVFDHYNAQQNIDIPKLFGLIREGVMLCNGVYTAMAGWSSYYAGQGGEIGGDNSNDFNSGVPMDGGPWNGAGSVYNIDEIIGQGNTASGASYITNSGNTWWCLPFVGELWPDSAYDAQWYSGNASNVNGWGNLNNTGHSGSWYRMTTSSLEASVNTLHRNSAQGCASFFNGNQDSTQSPYNHNSNTYQANLLNDGLKMSESYNFSLPATFNVTRQWDVNGWDSSGNVPQEWTYAYYQGRQTQLNVYSASPAANNTTWGFYDGQTTGTLTNRASAAVRTYDPTGFLNPPPTSGNVSPTAGGWFIMNGLAPSTQSGINFVAQFAILGCLRTFHDAGVPTSAANFSSTSNIITTNGTSATLRIPPVPLVTFINPFTGLNVRGETTINVNWNLRYARWDGNQYTENYPPLDTAHNPPQPLLEWHDPQPVAFNLIYNEPSGVSPTAWYSVLTGDLVVPGSYSSGLNAIFPGSSYESPQYNYNFSWNPVPAALINLEVECFRLASTNTAFPHYGYHEIQINTIP
jgi:hypothetical protein